MKPLTLLFTGCTILAACNTEKKEVRNGSIPVNQTKRLLTMEDHSSFIPVDSANKMLRGYLEGINYLQNDSSLRSVIFSADSLRRYLSDTKIAMVKIMLARSLDFLNGQESSSKVSFNAGELSFIIAGFDANGDYVFSEGNGVLERGMPCPVNCPESGTASSDFLN